MANRNSKRRSKLARKMRASERWGRLLQRDPDQHKNTIKKTTV